MCSETGKARAMFSLSPPMRGLLGPLLLVVQENMVKLVRIPLLRVGG